MRKKQVRKNRQCWRPDTKCRKQVQWLKSSFKYLKRRKLLGPRIEIVKKSNLKPRSKSGIICSNFHSSCDGLFCSIYVRRTFEVASLCTCWCSWSLWIRNKRLWCWATSSGRLLSIGRWNSRTTIKLPNITGRNKRRTLGRTSNVFFRRSNWKHRVHEKKDRLEYWLRSRRKTKLVLCS